MKNKIVIGSLLSFLIIGLIGFGVLMYIRMNPKQTDVLANKANVEWYDEEGTEFVLHTVEELYEFLELSSFYDFKGQTIKLGADIVINEGNASDWAQNAPERTWYPIKKFAGTFDGQGHSISGLYMSGGESSMGMFTDMGKNCTIKNFRLLNSYIYSFSNGGTGSIVGTGSVNLDTVYSDAIVCGTRQYVGGLVGKLSGPVESLITNCWFDGTVSMLTDFGYYAGGLIGTALTMVTIEHCLNSGTIHAVKKGGGICLGGLCGVFDKGNSYKIIDSLSVGSVTSEGSTTYLGGIFGRMTGKSAIFYTDTFVADLGYSSGLGSSHSNSSSYGFCGNIPSEKLIGTEAYRWTSLDYENYWTLVDGGTPMLRSFTETYMDVPEGMTKAYNVDWYDKGAKESVIMTKEDLYGFYMLSVGNTFEEDKIKLGANIVINKGNAASWGKKAPELEWQPIKKFAGTFDGDGHTISGLYVYATQKKAGLFAQTMQTAVVKNLKIKNSYFESKVGDGTTTAYLGSVAGLANGTFDTIYSDVILVCEGALCGGIGGGVIKTEVSKFTNCWFAGSIRMLGTNGKYAGGIIGLGKADSTIAHCLNTGSISTELPKGGAYIGGLCGRLTNGATYNISDCLNAGRVETPPSKTYYSAIFGRLDGKSTAKLRNVYATKESCASTQGGVQDGSTRDGIVIKVSESDILGENGYKWTTLNFDKYWAIVDEATPVLKSFGGKSTAGLQRMVDISWFNTNKTSHKIDTAQELYGLYLLSGTKDFKGETIKLTADITLNEGDATTWGTTAPAYEWIPIKKFAGTFNAYGHTISGLYLKTETKYAGLFSQTTQDTVVKDLLIKNSYLESTAGEAGASAAVLGSVAGLGKGQFVRVYSEAILVSDTIVCGGIVGQVSSTETSRFTNCWFNGSVTVNNKYGGGIVGLSKANTIIVHCLNSGTITSTLEKGGAYVGGFAGYLANNFEYTIKDCLNVGVITAKTKTYYGAIFGRLHKSSTATVTNVYTMKGVSPSKESLETGATLNGEVVRVDKTDLLGEKALESVSGLSFTGKDIYWITVKGNTPILKCFEVLKQEIDLPEEVGTVTNPYVIASKEDLLQFYQDSLTTDFEGKYFRLDADITWNEDPKAEGAEKWYPIGIDSEGNKKQNFAGNFNGNNHTISGLYNESASVQGIGFIGRTVEGASIRNLVLDNCYFKSTNTGNAYVGSVVSYVAGATIIENVYSDAELEISGKYSGGFVGVVVSDASLTMNDCWYDGELNLETTATYAGGLVGRLRGSFTATNCLNSGKITTETAGAIYVGGLCGYIQDAEAYTFTDCMNTGIIDCVTDASVVGSAIGYIKETTAQVQCTDVYFVTDERSVGVGMVGGFEYQSGSTPVAGTIPVTRAELTGTEAETNASGLSFTALNATDVHWMSVTDGMPKLDCFANIEANVHVKRPSTDPEEEPEGTEANPYIIDSYEDFEAFYNTAQSDTLAGKHYKLATNIEWQEDSWTPIPEFAGVLDGDGHTISGIHVNETSAHYAGIFRKVTGATIKNVRIEDSIITSSKNYSGVIAGNGYGTFEQIHIASDVSVNTTGTGAAGILAYAGEEESSFTQCWNEGAVMVSGSSKYCAGGFVGRANVSVKIENCLNEGNINGSTKSAGGFVGWISGGAETEIRNSVNAGTITADKQKGALVGYTAVSIKLEHCYDISAMEKLATHQEDITLTYANSEQEDFVDVQNISSETFEHLGSDVWTKETGKIPTLTCFVWNVFTDGSVSKPYILDSEDDLQSFNTYVNAEETKDEYKVKNYRLAADITLSSSDNSSNWTPIEEFAGVFDGGGHTINGIKVVDTTVYSGMFRNLTGATIKSICIDNSTFALNGAHYVAAVAGRGYGTFEKVRIAENVTVTLTGSKQSTAGMLALADGGETTFIECWNAGAITNQDGDYAGGFVSKVGAKTTFTDCLNTGAVSTSGKYAGGIVSWNSTSAGLDMIRCVNSGRVSGGTYSNVLIGLVYQQGVTTNRCYNTCSDVSNFYTLRNGYTLSFANGSKAEDCIDGTGLAAETFSHLDSAVWTITTGAIPALKCFE